MRNPHQENQTIGNFDTSQINRANQYAAGQPLLSQAQSGATNFYNMLGPEIRGLFQGANSVAGNANNPLFNAGVNTLSTGANALGAYGNSILANNGALTPQGERDVSQQTRAIQEAQGTAGSNAALGTELLNRQSAQQQREQFGAGLVGQSGGLSNQAAGLLGQRAGLLGQAGGLVNTAAGIETGGLNNLLGVQNAQTSNYTNLTNPILGYLGNLFAGNQQASEVQAQIGAQQAASNKSGTGGAISGIGSLIGTVATAAL
jgi:hypothetical protein